MLVHAHPDDETINDGATMAKYVAEGAAVCLVTCTLGEEGEVLVEDLAHLAPDQNDDLGSAPAGRTQAGHGDTRCHRFHPTWWRWSIPGFRHGLRRRRSCHASRRAP